MGINEAMGLELALTLPTQLALGAPLGDSFAVLEKVRVDRERAPHEKVPGLCVGARDGLDAEDTLPSATPGVRVTVGVEVTPGVPVPPPSGDSVEDEDRDAPGVVSAKRLGNNEGWERVTRNPGQWGCHPLSWTPLEWKLLPTTKAWA